jgi:hypothetical protein
MAERMAEATHETHHSEPPQDPQDHQAAPDADAQDPSHTATVAQEVQHQVEHVFIATANFASTVIALLVSALGVVAALAWNKALSDWLPTVIHLDDPLARDFAYAGVATFVAIVTVPILGFVNSRLRGRNLLMLQPVAQAQQGRPPASRSPSR